MASASLKSYVRGERARARARAPGILLAPGMKGGGIPERLAGVIRGPCWCCFIRVPLLSPTHSVAHSSMPGGWERGWALRGGLWAGPGAASVNSRRRGEGGGGGGGEEEGGGAGSVLTLQRDN